MASSVSVVTPAASATVVTVPEAKRYARIDGAFEESDLIGYIDTATQIVEAFTRRALLEQTLRLDIDPWDRSHCVDDRGSDEYGADLTRLFGGWPGRVFVLPRAPAISVTSVKYKDADGVEQILDPALYFLQAPAGPFALPGRVVRAYNASWPTVQPIEGAISITWKAGYGTTAASVPATLRTVIRQLVTGYFNVREPLVIGTIIAKNPEILRALWPFRVLDGRTW